MADNTNKVEDKVEEAAVSAEVSAKDTVAKDNSKKDAKKAAAKKDKVSFKEKLSKFWRSNKSELKKIVWYSRKDTLNSTLLVLVCLIICSVVVSILDLGFSSAIMALGKLL